VLVGAGPDDESGTWRALEPVLGGNDTWTKHDGPRRTQCLAQAGLGRRL
jgi:hypothetical protein